MSGLTAHAISARAAVSCRAVLRRKRISVRVSAVPRHATCAAADLESLPIPAKLKQIIGMFQLVPDPMSRYKQLLFYAAKLKEFPDDARVEENKVQGCVSQVWVLPRIEDGKVYFVADSDSQLTKGLAALLCEGLSGASPKEILAVEPDFVELLGLGQSLTPSRTNGFMNMLRLMQKKTLEAFMAAEAAKEAA
jgi:sulfur transfer protein SufE